MNQLSTISGIASLSQPGVNNNQQTGGGQQQQQSGTTPITQPQQREQEKLYRWIKELCNTETREASLLELSKKRESVPELAPMLWNSFGTVVALLNEIITIYPALNPPNLTPHQSNTVCNALALLQCLASHTDTRSHFLKAHIPLFLYPFLHTTCKNRPFEYLRLTSLGVIGALVKTDDPEVINFLLSTEIIPLCLRIMEAGSELSKTVATFILQKIMQDDSGLQYICQTYERFSHVAVILNKMVTALTKEKSARLLKHVIRCYQRLSENHRAREALRQCLPTQLKDNTFAECLENDNASKKWLKELIKNLDGSPLHQQLLTGAQAGPNLNPQGQMHHGGPPQPGMMQQQQVMQQQQMGPGHGQGHMQMHPTAAMNQGNH